MWTGQARLWSELLEDRQPLPDVEQRERGLYDALSQGRVAGAPERVAEGSVHEQRARRVYLGGHLLEHRDRYGRDAGGLYDALYQSDRLMAQRSNRGQEHGVHPVVFEVSRYLGSRMGDEPPRRRDGAHEAEVPLAHGAQKPAGGHLQQIVGWKG